MLPPILSMEEIKLVVSEMISNYSKEVKDMVAQTNEQYSQTQTTLKDEIITHIEKVNEEQTFKILNDIEYKHDQSISAINELKEETDKDFKKLISDLSNTKEELSSVTTEFFSKRSKDRNEAHLNFK